MTAATTAPIAGRRALVVGLLAGVVSVAFESVAVATAMPQAARELGAVANYAWAFTLFVLGMVFSTAVAGRASDRLGPVKPLLVGMTLFVVGLLVAGAAPTMTVLVLGRFLQGLGGGALNLCLMVVVAQAFADDERARIMTAFSFCWVMPAFLGPPISAWITHRWGWHWVFWVIIPLVLAAAVVSARPLVLVQARHVVHPEQVPVPLWAAGLAALGAGLLQGATQSRGLLALAMGAVALVALAVSVPRLMPPGFLRVAKGTPAVDWTRLCQAGAFFATEAMLPLALVEQRGLSLVRAGLVLTIGSLGWTLGSWLQSRTWLGLRREHIITVGLAATAGGLLCVALGAWWPTGTTWLVYAGWTLAGLGMGLGIASTSLAVMQLSSQERLGRETASLQTAEGLGNSLVSGLAGSLFHLLHGGASARTFGAVFTLTAVVASLGVLTQARIGRLDEH